MRGSRILIAAGLALLGTRAVAVNVTGSAGTVYSRSSSSSSSGNLSGTRSWDFAGNLSFSGALVRPSMLSYGGGVNYQTLHSAYFESTSASDAIEYNLSASALTEKPLSLTTSFSQGWTRFNSEGGGPMTGDTRTTSEGASVTLTVRDMPSVSLQATRVDTVNHSFGQQWRTDTTALGASVSQILGPFAYSLSYGTRFNEGTFAETNYRAHDFNGTVAADLSKNVQATVTDQYHLRLPTRDAATNPRYDDHGIGAGVSWAAGDKVTSRMDYFYQRSLVTAPTVPEQELISHAASSTLSYRYLRDLSFTASASGNVGLSRSGGTEERLLGQSVGGGVQWRHEYERFQLNADGSLALNAAEPENRSAVLGYTARGGSSLATWVRGWSYSLGYDASYGSAAAGREGWSFGHGVTALASGAPWRGAQAQVGVKARSSRAESPLFGTSVSRSVTLSLLGSWKKATTSLVLGMSDGLSDPLRRTGFENGLFIPSAFNTRSRHATLFATAPLAKKLSVGSGLRYFESTSPGRAKQWETAGWLSVQYAIGAFTFSADDTVSRGGLGEYWRTANVLMVRATRSFGATISRGDP